ncbi:MAG: ATP-dependent helicase [bacterium]
MHNFLEELNPIQKEAVTTCEGSSLIVAGAGAGKTRVLTYRIAYLLSQGVKPWAILALTFTNKAAKEMKERIGSLVGYQLASSIWMGTFHSIFSKILRIEADHLGYEPNFTIYDTSDSRSLLRSIIKEMKLDEQVYKVNDVHARISMAKNNLITPPVYLSNSQIIAKDREQRKPRIADIYKMYTSRCKKSNAMDFDDLLLNTNILLRDFPEVLSKYQEHFKYILVDEYQDTNYAQYLIVNKLGRPHQNICVVGDDAQSIYSFRGAKIENILNFKNDYPTYRLFKLEQNYRSTKVIVDAANSLIQKNKGQIQKTVWSDNEAGNKISIFNAATDSEEGYLVTNQIVDNMLMNQLRYDDFAILYRTNAQSRIFEDALRKRNIPYKIYGGLSFYQRKEIKDLLAYFRIVINKHDDEAFRRIINYPARGIGDTTLGKIEELANLQNTSFWNVINNLENNNPGLNKGTISKIDNFIHLINNFSARLKALDAYELANQIAASSGILSEYSNDKAPESVSKYENIQELLNAIREFSENLQDGTEPITLDKYMENVALLTDMDKEKEEDLNKVTLMTIHSAKGLEFNHVFIVGVEEGLFPSNMSVGSMQELEEERRLFYVALTRARRMVTISFAKSRFRWGSIVNSKPSRFIKDIDQKFIDFPLDVFDNDDQMAYRENNSSINQFKRNKNKAGTVSKTGLSGFRDVTKISTGKEIKQKISNFVADDPDKIQSGMMVLHQLFGKGKVLNIEGSYPNKKATVFFPDSGQKQLLLKFAKLKIVN